MMASGTVRVTAKASELQTQRVRSFHLHAAANFKLINLSFNPFPVGRQQHFWCIELLAAAMFGYGASAMWVEVRFFFSDS